jgi:hypothetical protein
MPILSVLSAGLPARPFLGALMLALGLVAGAAPAAPEGAFEAAMRHFDAAQTGDAAALEQAVAAIDGLRKAEPTNPLLLAYAGAAETLKARTTWLPWKKMSHAEDGMAMQDKALALLGPAHDAPMQRSTPGVLETKLTVASTFLAVPSFMNRGARGEKLLKEVLDSPLLAGSPLPFRGVVWMRAARLAQDARRVDEARHWYGLVISQDAPQAAAAQAALKDLPQ